MDTRCPKLGNSVNDDGGHGALTGGPSDSPTVIITHRVSCTSFVSIVSPKFKYDLVIQTWTSAGQTTPAHTGEDVAGILICPADDCCFTIWRSEAGTELESWSISIQLRIQFEPQSIRASADL